MSKPKALFTEIEEPIQREFYKTNCANLKQKFLKNMNEIIKNGDKNPSIEQLKGHIKSCAENVLKKITKQRNKRNKVEPPWINKNIKQKIAKKKKFYYRKKRNKTN